MGNTTVTHFTGADDSTIIGNGDRLLFKLASTDASKDISMTFDDAVFIKSGFIQCRNAPFGAYIDIEIIHTATQTVVGAFGKRIPIIGNNLINLPSENSSSMPTNLELRITVFNSDSTDGIQDNAAAFDVAGCLILYRTFTDGTIYE